jgi:nucleoredoxin
MALQKLLGVKQLYGKAGSVDVAALEGKTVFLYFSAQWCPSCRAFTPVLAKLYKEQKMKRSDFEIIFASWDQSEAEFDEYAREHPWIAIPFADRKAVEALQNKFQVSSIPTLILFDGNGQLVTKGARNLVVADPSGEDFPWISEDSRKKHAAAPSGSTYFDPSYVVAFLFISYLIYLKWSDGSRDTLE